jgi:hypothetical protein
MKRLAPENSIKGRAEGTGNRDKWQENREQVPIP